MCNRYASDIRKAGLEREMYGFEEWSETRINAILEVFPKSYGPVIRALPDGTRELHKMRWGLPGPASIGGAPVTNIRNVQSPHWRRVLGVRHRCLVPFTAFSEYDDASPKGKKQIRWFAPRDRGVMYFAGVYDLWQGDYGTKSNPNEGDHKLFSFLTTEANDLVRPVHAKAMPVVLSTPAECDEWLSAPASEIGRIQARVLPRSILEIVGTEEAESYVGSYLK